MKTSFSDRATSFHIHFCYRILAAKDLRSNLYDELDFEERYPRN